MNVYFLKVRWLVCWALVASLLSTAQSAVAADKLKALIIDGQNNHHWQATTPILRAALERCGRFSVDVATSPAQGQNMEGFQPDFSKYSVVVLNYNGADWPAATKAAFDEYVKNGGGMVSVHAADNSFPDWPEYNKMIAVGGWGRRTQASGPMIRWRDGKQVTETGAPGSRGTHGRFFSWDVEARHPDHPILKGLPPKWLHNRDELYSKLAGPAENVTILATAHSDTTQEEEPILMTINYGKGRVFHTTMGHDVESMEDVGFVTTLDRGAEWAATGEVTIPVPSDFPTPDKTSVWIPSGK